MSDESRPPAEPGPSPVQRDAMYPLRRLWTGRWTQIRHLPHPLTDGSGRRRAEPIRSPILRGIRHFLGSVDMTPQLAAMLTIHEAQRTETNGAVIPFPPAPGRSADADDQALPSLLRRESHRRRLLAVA